MSLAGEERSIIVRRSHAARRYTLRLKVKSRQLVLTLPLRASVSGARAFLERHESWVSDRLVMLPAPIPFEPGGSIPVRGVLHAIEHRSGLRGTTALGRSSAGEPIIVVSGDPVHVSRRVSDFLKRLARADLEAASRRHAATLGVTLKRIAIKDTTSRWGSCSAQGALSYSWRIIMAPPAILDYLAAHEVAHRREMNHSPRFWAVVRHLCPEMDAAEHWLKTEGSGLHRYG